MNYDKHTITIPTIILVVNDFIFGNGLKNKFIQNKIMIGLKNYHKADNIIFLQLAPDRELKEYILEYRTVEAKNNNDATLDDVFINTY